MSVLENLPRLKAFLFCIPLKIGAVFSVGFGMGTSGGYIVLTQLGFFTSIEDWLRNVLGVIALFFFIASVLLNVGIFMKDYDWTYQVWLYGAMCFLTGVIAVYLILILRLIMAGKFWIKLSTLPVLPFFAVFVYLIVIVNSYRFEAELQELDEP